MYVIHTRCLWLCGKLTTIIVYSLPVYQFASFFFGGGQQEGDGLPDMCTPSVVDKALHSAGFELLETRDMALDENPGGVTWYYPLTPGWNVFSQRFQFNWLGRRVTKAILHVMEMVRICVLNETVSYFKNW